MALLLSACANVEGGGASQTHPDTEFDRTGSFTPVSDAGLIDSPASDTVIDRDGLLDWDPTEDCKAARVSVGANHICAITRGGHLFCWGYNSNHQLGKRGGEFVCDDDAPCERLPQPVADLEDVVGVSMSSSHTCALLGDGSVWCWGSDAGGMLGVRVDETCFNPHAQTPEQERIPCTPTPTRVSGIEHAADIDGWGATCIAEADGRVKCWGWYGRVTPTTVPRVQGVISLEDGCARHELGGVTCWDSAQLQSQATTWQATTKDLTKGYNQVCLIDDEDQLWCWGLDSLWSDGVQVCQGCTFTKVPGVSGVAQVSGSLQVTWLRDLAGNVRLLELGNPTIELVLPSPAIDISSGYYGACAVVDDGEVYCWSNPSGIDFNNGLDLTTEPRHISLCP